MRGACGSGIAGETFLEKVNQDQLFEIYDKNKINSNIVKIFQIQLLDNFSKINKICMFNFDFYPISHYSVILKI